MSLIKVIQSITDINNTYRASNSSMIQKLTALWEMGDCLHRMGIEKPHAVGWSIQEETKGLIKRPTVFRSHKIRQIWPSRQQFLNDVGGIKQMSFLTDLLPLIDPKQSVRSKIRPDELQLIYRKACGKDASAFKAYLLALKEKYSHGRLGKPLDKDKHLNELTAIMRGFKKMQIELMHLFEVIEREPRENFILKTPSNELEAFSNMCLSLTTKDNFRLYKRRGPEKSVSDNETFKFLYDSFKNILSKNVDTERARLRRLVSAEAFAQLSDMISSIRSEDSVKDYRARQKLSIGL